MFGLHFSRNRSFIILCLFGSSVVFGCFEAALASERNTVEAFEEAGCGAFDTQENCEAFDSDICSWKKDSCVDVCNGESRKKCIDNLRNHCCWNSDEACVLKRTTNGCGLVSDLTKCSVLSKKTCRKMWKKEKNCYWYKYAGCREPCNFQSESACVFHAEEECEWVTDILNPTKQKCSLKGTNTLSPTSSPSASPSAYPTKSPTTKRKIETPTPFDALDLVLHVLGTESVLEQILSQDKVPIADTLRTVFESFMLDFKSDFIDVIIEECPFSSPSETELCNRFSYFINRNQYQSQHSSSSELLLAVRLLNVNFNDPKLLQDIFAQTEARMLNIGLELNDMHVLLNYGNNLNSKEEQEKPLLERRKPNIVMMLADDLGYGDVGYQSCSPQADLGNENICAPEGITKNIDAMSMGEHSAVFKRFHVSPSCGPSRSSILTGREPIRECAINNIFREIPGELPPISSLNCVTSIAEMAKKSGHRTFHSGKWHVGKLEKVNGDGEPTPSDPDYVISHPGMNGFDKWVSTPRQGATYNLNCGCFPDLAECRMGIYNNSFFWNHYSLNNGNERKYMNQNDPKLFSCENYRVGKVTDESSADDLINSYGWTNPIIGDDSKFIVDRFIEFLEEDKKNAFSTPFFAALWFHAPHGPFVSPPEYLEPARELVMKLPDPGKCGIIFDESVGFSDSKSCQGTLKDANLCEEICIQVKAHYYGSVMALDEQVGRVRQYLKDNDLYENTVIIFSSDNGPARYDANRQPRYIGPGSAAHLEEWKFSVFEGGTRVPMVIEYPGLVASNRVVGYPATNVDYLPTVLDLLNVPYPENAMGHVLDGISLVPHIAGVKRPRVKPIGIVNVDRDIIFLMNSSAVVKLYKKSETIYTFDSSEDRFVETKQESSEDQGIDDFFEVWYDKVFDPSPCNKQDDKDGVDPETCIDETTSDYF